VRKKSFLFFELRRRTVHFDPGEIRYFQHLRERRADIIEMRKDALGIGVSFPAIHSLAVGSEPVEKILFFSRSFVDEPRESGFDRFQFSGGAL